ncbi:glycosyltransferase family A protein [Hydrogenophaga sp.]|uniref:glycosyltransferase family 2 protein n=1 Tax=Hydrogenophaga sp. TaxID=1904254 RepID=UPI00272FD0A1|nr:glycosyltransferase family A protein [Hydrogenophaga sp.]
MPTVSVVVPTYNAGRYIAEAVTSILNQDFTDFELLLIDDGSTDETASVIQRFAADSRVRLLHNERNIGLIATLHRAYAECRAPFIARMDADDICDPKRLGRQVVFLRNHPEVDIVGGAIRFFGNVAPTVFQFPTDHAAIRPAMLFYCPLAHPALMFRRELVEQGLIRYDDDFRYAEDYHLWSRLLLRVTSANLPEVVLDYRLHAQQVSSGSSDKQYAASLRVRRKMLMECGLTPSDGEVTLHESVILERPLPMADYLQRLASWFDRLESVNASSQYWDGPALQALLKAKFLDTARRVGADLRALSCQDNTGRYVAPADIAVVVAQPKTSSIVRIKRRVKALVWRLSTAARKP